MRPEFASSLPFRLPSPTLGTPSPPCAFDSRCFCWSCFSAPAPPAPAKQRRSIRPPSMPLGRSRPRPSMATCPTTRCHPPNSRRHSTSPPCTTPCTLPTRSGAWSNCFSYSPSAASPGCVTALSASAPTAGSRATPSSSCFCSPPLSLTSHWICTDTAPLCATVCRYSTGLAGSATRGNPSLWNG